MRIALGLQYDGSPYAGWQVQHNQNTVQAELEKAITAFIGEEAIKHPVHTITAGRTDAGVHALGQVVHFDTHVEREDFSWVRGVNSFLPGSIVVNWAKVVPEEFSARFSAFERTYIYALHAGPCRSPLMNERAGYVLLPPNQWFDVDTMRQAAQCLIGEHDFSSFRSSECQSKTPVKTMYTIDIISDEPWLYFRMRGNAFLHHMVRNLVGCFLQIGRGRQNPEWMAQLLAAKDRKLAAPTFMPDGLYLAKIAYPEQFAIPAPWLANSWIPSEIIRT
ncbi:tRNA pseudouridine(38,39,40) synthase TruA [Polynucleobacter wuianus]|uniref:tRNA pseudouridine synthase A n=1 Tax=Polynucleobacter wuianus TaxID=1743168 RepID=A0A191UEF9_9BURK|nr:MULTISPECIES: tRNA pseudouridine(38-40) synthase TruA [Polynucleobacter]ANI99394.1 tRNA pseudouridine(38,39,40) synthase TruA [Polynucleobacter wuianus]MBU3552001.1 tRNA pseudouridine(38-40) synthase TruA [Polynucleobacter sp. MWH-Post4-6-1]